MLKKDKQIILIYILIFFIISILSIYSAQKLLPTYMNTLYIKQILWYILGFIFIYFISKININIYKYSIHLYILFTVLLLGLFFFAPVINSAKCWYQLPIIGNFQPSEFMKIVLIIVLSNELYKFEKTKKNIKKEFMFLLKIFLIVFIPSILTFLQPDTGVVLIYLVITFTMLFISTLSYFWFVLIFIIIFLFVILFLSLYHFNIDLFINLFGTDSFLRIERLLNWSSSDGYQLVNGMSSIGGAGLFGYGYLNTPIYFPEPHTDFIFATFSSNFGFIGSLVLILLILFFDLHLIKIAKKIKKKDKYLIFGFIGMLVYQQVQNIGMTFGVIPITGITLPFISYGGSSLLSYMILIGLIMNIKKSY